jgi:16S rRNA (cytosine967-C5)-methyltransferase
MIAPARTAALEVLRAVATGRRTLPDALNRASSTLVDERDRALTSDIATGTLRWRGAIDHVLQRVASRPLEHAEPDVLEILRLSAYQLIHLTRVPASAVVHDGVDLTRARGHGNAAGFVNAVLRRVASQPSASLLPPRPAATDLDAGAAGRAAVESYLSTTLSHPRWLVRRWLDRVGFEAAEAWCAFNNSRAPVTLRANTLRIDRDGLAARLEAHGVRTAPTRFAPDGLVVIAGHPLRTPLAQQGLFVAQDEASQLVALLAEAAPGDEVLDACAAPGGKTVAMAAAMRGTGRLVAVDVRPRRMRVLQDAITACGAASVRLVQADLAVGLPFLTQFDCVFVDAPCSGLGTLRRDPEIRWRRTRADLARFAAQQVQLLDRAAGVVRPGGRLVYATCSSEADENEDVVARFLASHPEYVAAAWRRGTPPEALEAVLDPDGALRTWPHVHGLEAFFGVVLGRRRL